VLRLERIADLHRAGGPLCLALGVFDGVHTGHQAVVRAAVKEASDCGGVAGVLTFDPHPIRVLAPGKAPRRLLASLDHKAAILGELGIDLMGVVKFDEEFAQMDAGAFVAALVAGSGDLRLLAVGEDWRFGHGRRGDVAMLRQAGVGAGFAVVAVPPVMMDGERVSSTRIRQAIRDGNLAAAARMLGRPYAVAGVVVAGRKLGRQLGFPTANLTVTDEQLPPEGVWVVEVRGVGPASVRGVANLGCRPTVDAGGARTLEVHLLGYAGELYGQWIEVVFVRFLREERKFGTLEALQEQIARDAQAAEH
jgi:riboflavin kinase/FMN adenylyltransferase